jgi:16S rRNA G527 N7-methylase RsmG
VITLGMRHVEVRCADVKVLIDEVGSGVTPPFDVVTARGFGPPEFTLRSATRLIRPGGRIVISEPPAGDRWSAELLDELGLSATASGRVRVFALPSAPLV